MASFCTYYNQAQCRSCEWIELDYSQQLEKKERLLRGALEGALGPTQSQVQRPAKGGIQLEVSVGSPLRAFRDRAKMVVTGTVENPVIGLQGESSLDEGRELLSCPIHHPALNQLIQAMPEFILNYNLAPYRIAERRGELKAIIAFHSHKSGQMYLRFILRSKDCVARIKKMLPSLLEKFPSLVCVSANIQPVPHAILEGPEEIILTERKSIDHGDLKLAPRAFVQTNGFIAEKLYQTAASWISDATGDIDSQAKSFKMLELFCGQGAFSFYAARNAAPPKEILGIEINSDAVQTANETAQRLELNFMKFKCKDITKPSELLDEIQTFHPHLILANPPRRGLGEGIELLIKAKPQHILYSSCEVETLASDLKTLAKDYVVHRVQLFDMFPHTKHFETLTWLKRK